ncbi:ABC transporter ATP-binding protein [Tardiphaga sp. OK246]|uniref:ABC transporter ATP-binding protein n=1 Tax=Tardiphaga sp. OK246 TaxID=1855307 RepID=UPI000B777582|nr:ABC transporter ATP-binding protein [Tardiphaga sp. OK246]
MVDVSIGDSAGLLCEAINAGWDETHVLSDITFSLPKNQALAVLGRNGVGKSTLLSTIAGRARLHKGRISYDGSDIVRLPGFARARMGIGYVPQEREIFPSLTVQENLLVAERKDSRSAEQWTLQRIYELFPRLYERRDLGGTQLSGGEQQMLSLGRALMGNPTLLLMDEPFEGLAPVIVDIILAAVQKVLREASMTVLMVEQHVDIALDLTHRMIVLDRGAIIFDGSDGSGAVDREMIKAMVGIDKIAG